jgi:peptidoglycan hydrolase-like protein with peptidoglycan-binding domain
LWLNLRVLPACTCRLPDPWRSRPSWIFLLLLPALAGPGRAGGQVASQPPDKPFRTTTVSERPPSAVSPRSVTSVPAAPVLAPTNTGAVPGTYPRPVRTTLEAQIALDRLGLSPGSIDGRMGPQTHAALRAFQQRKEGHVTGELDSETRNRLALATPPLTVYTVTSNDLASLQPLSPTWLGKSQQTVLGYETLLELIAEGAHAHPGLLRTLNPDLNWTNLLAGTVVAVPDIIAAAPLPKAAFARIQLVDKTLETFDGASNLLTHFPCSIAQRVEKRPIGELHVATLAPDPNYTFDPEVFPESAEARQLDTKLVLPPGPNNPVGTVWIGLDKTGYGIHGTPSPEQVGRTESHGCFRLSNWNATLLLKLAWVGMPVYVEP